jgi:hypothetical protein
MFQARSSAFKRKIIGKATHDNFILQSKNALN